MLPWRHPRKCPRDIPLGCNGRCNQGNHWHMVVALGTCVSCITRLACVTQAKGRKQGTCVICVRTITRLRLWKHQPETTDKPIIINMFTSLRDKASWAPEVCRKENRLIGWTWKTVPEGKFLWQISITYNTRPAFLGCPLTKLCTYTCTTVHCHFTRLEHINRLC